MITSYEVDTVVYSIRNYMDLLKEVLLLKENDEHLFFGQMDNFICELSGLREIFYKWSQEEKMFQSIADKLLENTLYSAERVISFRPQVSALCLTKLEFELIPLVRVLYIAVYYCSKVKGNPEKEKNFEEHEYPQLISNEYIKSSEETGFYKYDVTIGITAYNNLDVTKSCVESLLETIDPSLNYELILFNNGSVDGTMEYFQSIAPTKQIDLKENDLTFSILVNNLCGEGKYILGVSNDIIFCKNSIKNLLTCIKADEKNSYIVPSTTHMLNGQEPILPEGVETVSEILSWAEGNNISNPYLWEHRVILFNPVMLIRSVEIFGKNAFRPPFFLRFSGGNEGNDSIMSALVRRSGNKCILAKDAFCYHHGSITRKEENIIDNKEFWDVKHAEMKKAINIKHFTTGRCYSLSLLKKLDFPHKGHIEILGLNCGLSSDPLKIKESYKEHHHNLDCFVTNMQDTPEYKEDLPSISDAYLLIDQYESVLSQLQDKKYQWIFYLDKFSFSHEEENLYQEMKEALTDDGVLILGQPTEVAKAYFTPHDMVEYEHREEYVAFLIYKK